MIDSIEKSLQIMKAMSDESRLLILNTLFEKPQYVEEIAKRLDLAASTVSFHLKKLEEVGLITKEKKQYYSEFSIKKEIFDSRLIDLVSFQNIEKIAQEKRVLQFNEKILKTFIKNGKIEKLPKQLKKKLIILEWIIEKFEADRTYTEEEVNYIILNHYQDYCGLRRDLVDFRYFERERSIYKRINN